MNEFLQSLFSTLLAPVAFALVVGVAWLLRDQIRAIVAGTGATEIGVTSQGITLKFDPEKLAREMYAKQGMGEPSPQDVQEVAAVMQSFGPFAAGRRILWVDDHPENNRLERAALLDWKVDVQARRTTEEAMQELRYPADKPFDLVISDWFRNRQPEGPRLAELMRQEATGVPILFYFTTNSDDLFKEIQDQAKALHSASATSSPRELLRWTFAELVRAALRDPETNIVL
jgi:CheY-like chemotaxis protein